MPENKKTDDIINALEKAEKLSEELNARKARTQERIKKHIKPEAEVDRYLEKRKEEKIQKESDAHLAKTTMVYFYLLNILGVGTIYYYKVGVYTERVFLFLTLVAIGIFIAYQKSLK